MSKLKDETGNVYGRLTVIERAENDNYDQAMWLCECFCGKKVVVRGGALRSGGQVSCGCLHSELTRERMSSIGGLFVKYQKEYDVWRNMIKRCHNPDWVNYEDYGLNGIKVCGRWKGTNGFKNFIEDMGKRPAKGYQLDRIDGDYGYCPWNCRWVTRRENQLNRTFTHWITFNGITMCLTDWANKLGMSVSTLNGRLNTYGWSVEEALTIPVGITRKKIL